MDHPSKRISLKYKKLYSTSLNPFEIQIYTKCEKKQLSFKNRSEVVMNKGRQGCL